MFLLMNGALLDRVFYHLETLDEVVKEGEKKDYNAGERVLVEDPDKANLVSSLTTEGKHRPVLDIDNIEVSVSNGELHIGTCPWESYDLDNLHDALVACGIIEDEGLWDRGESMVWYVKCGVTLVPSASPRCYHLYLSAECEWEQYEELLLVLQDCEVLEEGYVSASVSRRETFLRLDPQSKPVENRKHS